MWMDGWAGRWNLSWRYQAGYLGQDGAGRGFLGNVIPPPFLSSISFPRIDTTHQPFLDRQMAPILGLGRKGNHGFTARVYTPLDEA